MLEEPKYLLIMIKSLSILVLFSVILITGNIPLQSKSFTENKVSSPPYIASHLDFVSLLGRIIFSRLSDPFVTRVLPKLLGLLRLRVPAAARGLPLPIFNYHRQLCAYSIHRKNHYQPQARARRGISPSITSTRTCP